jgi:hypothetical protein
MIHIFANELNTHTFESSDLHLKHFPIRTMIIGKG